MLLGCHILKSEIPWDDWICWSMYVTSSYGYTYFM